MKNFRLAHFTLFQATLFIVLFITFAGTVIAWSGPSGTAPANNVSAPINVGATSQIKNGALGANSLAVYGNGYVQGRMGVGTASPGALLDITAPDEGPWALRIKNSTYSGEGFKCFQYNNGIFRCDNAGNLALSIATNGNVGFGTPSPTTRLDVYGTHTTAKARLYSTGNGGSSDASLDMWASEPGVSYDGSGIGNNVNGHPYYGRRNSALGQSYLRFYAGAIYLYTGSGDAAHRVSLDTSGNMSVTGNIQASAFLYSSDKSLKKDIQTLDSGLDIVKALRGVSFTWKDSGEKSVGLVAQEVEQVLPELVSTNSETGLKSVQYGNLVAPLIEAVKEQQREIDTLKQQVQDLTNKVERR